MDLKKSQSSRTLCESKKQCDTAFGVSCQTSHHCMIETSFPIALFKRASEVNLVSLIIRYKLIRFVSAFIHSKWNRIERKRVLVIKFLTKIVCNYQSH